MKSQINHLPTPFTKLPPKFPSPEPSQLNPTLQLISIDNRQRSSRWASAEPWWSCRTSGRAGRTPSSSCSRAWATPSASATSGASPSSSTATAEVRMPGAFQPSLPWPSRYRVRALDPRRPRQGQRAPAIPIMNKEFRRRAGFVRAGGKS